MKNKLTIVILMFITTSLFAPVPTNGLVAYYPFKGNANDESGNGHPGTVSGATLTTDRFGISNCAYYFDGIDDYIKVLNSDDFNFTSGNYSIGVWLYLAQTSSTYNSTMISKRDKISGIVSGFGAYMSGTPSSLGPRVFNFTIGGGANPLINDNVQLPLNTWHHVVVTFQNSIQETKLYVDHILKVTSYDLPLFLPNDASVFFGSDSAILGQGYNYNFNGKLDDIVFYNKPLNQLEVDTLFYNYNIGINKFENNSTISNLNCISNDNLLHINANLNLKTSEVEFQLVDLVGNILLNNKYSTIGQVFAKTIDISGLSNGIYFVRLQNRGNYLTKKIVIFK